MSTLIGGLGPYLALAGGVAVVVIGALWRMLSGAKKAGVNEQKAKEAVAREQDIQKIKRAADAGAGVKPGGMLDDPYNRDRRGKP